MAAPLSGAGQQLNMPITQALQPTSMDPNRNVERQEPDPQERQIQAQSAPSAQSQTTNNSSEDSAKSLSIKDLAKFLSELQKMSGDDELPNRGTILDIKM
ncbi:MAG: hypothetical protein KAJ40_00960 [Alphaproteobacteria bacterium]|nr:hypothetical protein [Alphaproteobacteria bacterium]